MRLLRRAASYATGVLSFLGQDGLPWNLRVGVDVKRSGDLQVAVIGRPPFEPVPGPATLLFHSHDNQMWKLKNFLLVGRIERSGELWVFTPAKEVPGTGGVGPLTMMRNYVRWRKSAAHYLRRRGLATPRVPWDQIKEIERRASARRDREGRGDVELDEVGRQLRARAGERSWRWLKT